MNLLEYIRKNFLTPNTAVLRRLGASERLIDYLKHTSHNTNFNIVPQLIDGGGGKDWILAAESIGSGRIAWNSMGEIVWKDETINCESFTLFNDMFINPYRYRAFFKIEGLQEIPVHYHSHSNIAWTGKIDFTKGIVIDYDSTGVTSLSLNIIANSDVKCQFYIKKVEEVKTFTINWDNDYQIYTNINIGDALTSPPSPPLEPGYVFDVWYVSGKKLGENEDFIFTDIFIKGANEAKIIEASYSIKS